MIFIFNFCDAQQKYSNNWYFGNYAGLNFDTDPPTVLTDNILKGSIFLCANSKKGDLLFYTSEQGFYLYNKNHQPFDPFHSYFPITIPFRNNDNLFYILKNDFKGMDSVIFQYDIVDMTKNGGLGGIVGTTANFAQGELSFYYAVTGTADNKGSWFLTQSIDQSSILCYKFTETGVDSIPVVSNTGMYDKDKSGNGIIAKFSSKSNKVAIQSPLGFYVYDFNKYLGVVSNPLYIGISDGTECAFSLNERFLYYGKTLIAGQLYSLIQFDLLTKTEIIIRDSSQMNIQMARNGKIYFASYGKKHIGVINQPDKQGFACEIHDSLLYLQSGEAMGFFPAFVESFMQPPDMENFGTCEGDNTHFWFTDTTLIQSISWSFGDSHSSSAVEPYHKYATQGTYSVLCTILTKQGETLHYNKDVKIYPPTKKLVIKHE